MRARIARRHCAAVLLLAWTSWCSAGTPEPYGKVALPFEPNVGQTDDRAHFLARAPGVQVFLAPTEAVYRFQGKEKSAVVRMSLRGARRNAAGHALDPLPGHSHYLAGEAGRSLTRIPHYRRIEFRQVYRGIDLAYYGNGAQLEYDFVVAPGARPGAIALDVEGAGRLEIDDHGRLLMHTEAGAVVWNAPVAYQAEGGARHPVRSAYVLRGKNQVGFRVGRYDRRLPLVIDPVLGYSTLVGGTGHDRAHAIAVDAGGNAHITGQAGAVDFPTTPGAHDRASGGIFVTKLDATGSTLLYSTFLGAGRGTGIAVRDGHAYVTGWTEASGFATAGAYNNPMQGARNGFVAKLEPDGSGLRYAAVLGMFADPAGIAVDAAGSAYVAGTTSSNSFPTTPGAFQPTRPTAGDIYQGDIDGFFLKLDAAGSALLYSTYLASSENDQTFGVAVDADGKAYVSGTTLGRAGPFDGHAAAATPFPTTAGAYQAAFSGTTSAFVTKFDPAASGTASVVYSTVLGDGGRHLGRAVVVDAAGNAYVTGVAEANFPFTPGAYGVASPQAGGGFVAKLNAAGDGLAYCAVVRGVEAWKIAVDLSNNAFVTGLTDNSNSFVPVDPLPGISGGSLFLTRLDASGSTAVYSTYMQGHLDNSVAVAVDLAGNAYVSGTAHVSFTASPGAFQGTINGTATEAFVTRVGTAPLPVANRPPVADAGPDLSVFVGQSFVLDATSSSDPDGDALAYEWKDAANVVVGTSSTLTLTRPQGTHVFTLTVDDGLATDADAVTVTVNAALGIGFYGDGAGRVDSTDGRIACHLHERLMNVGSCQASYATPTPVTFVATPDSGSSFLGWVLGCVNMASCPQTCPGTGDCTYLVDQNLAVGARFQIQQHTLTVANGGNGKVTSPSHPAIDCGTACALTVPYDTSIDLVATPDPGFVFAGWSGACSGTNDICAVTMREAQSVSASFSEVALTGISITPATATVAVGGHQRYTILGTFSDGNTRAINADHSIEASDVGTCATTRSGAVKCWGQSRPLAAMPAYFGGVALSAGTSHTCAMLSDGTLNCEGTAVPGVQGAAAFASSSAVNYALMPDGTVKQWAFNTDGSLGSVTTTTVPGVQPPEVVPIDVGAEGGPPASACFVLSSGAVSCLRDTSPVPGISGALAVTAGVAHACALLSDGRVKCWGDNDWGQLGRGTVQPGTESWLQPADFVVEAVGVPISDAISVVAGDYYSCALMRDTTVKCWGQQWTSGSPDWISPWALTIRRAAGATALTGVSTVGAGAFHACASMIDGTANCWGTDTFEIFGVPGHWGQTELAWQVTGLANLVAPAWGTQGGGVAAIMANGRATARASGTATVTASVGPFSATAAMIVVNTGVGANVSVTPTDAATGTAPVTLTFSTVTQPGETSVVVNAGAPPAPSTSSFGLGDPPVWYEISTTAGYTPPITVCINYNGVAFNGPPAMFHLEAGMWTDVTTTVDTMNEIVCGSVTSLSPFALMVPPDTSPPQILAASASPAVLWPPNHKMTPVTVAVSVTDDRDPAPTCRIESVASNEPIDAPGDGATGPDWEVTGALALRLRAERSATGAGRIYRIGLRCEDASGNAATRSIEVAVPLRP
jgi:hypothetical protein